MPDIFVSPSIKEDKKNSSKKKDRLIYPKQAFSAYLFMPENVRFETQEPGESIILLLRKHWITNLPWVITSIILLVTPILVFPAVFLVGIIPQNISPSLVSFIILVWYLLTFSYLLVNFLLWYFTVSIVTNERIVDIDFINILNKKFAATRIKRVEDVTMRRGGFIRVLFDYGDVIIQTAAREHMFLFGAVPYPEKVVSIVNGLMGKEEGVIEL